MEQVYEVAEALTDRVQHAVQRSTEDGASLLTVKNAELHARFFRVLSDPSCLWLVLLLLDAPDSGRTVSELVRQSMLPKAASRRIWAVYLSVVSSSLSALRSRSTTALLIPVYVRSWL